MRILHIILSYHIRKIKGRYLKDQMKVFFQKSKVNTNAQVVFPIPKLPWYLCQSSEVAVKADSVEWNSQLNGLKRDHKWWKERRGIVKKRRSRDKWDWRVRRGGSSQLESIGLAENRNTMEKGCFNEEKPITPGVICLNKNWFKKCVSILASLKRTRGIELSSWVAKNSWF